MDKSPGKINLLITGAAGNLGGLLAEQLRNDTSINLSLMIHNENASEELRNDPRIKIFRADLADRDTLLPVLDGIDVVVHFAGVLFRHNPEKFLPVTNLQYLKNLLDASLELKVRRVILVSFPHVEGETFHDAPAMGSLDGRPGSVHASTRLEEEKYLFSKGHNGFEPVSLRAGMVYGKGILMIDAAKRLMKRGLLGIWRKPTWIHLVSIDDFLSSVKNAAVRTGIKGIYHIGDEGVQTLQEFLDSIAGHWNFKKPTRMPVFLIYLAAYFCEIVSKIFGTRSPLTRDFIKIGMASYYGDTSRMRKELLEEVKYKNYKDALSIF
ncbi:MAG: NAD(P)-dependent oxidoreductase [Spirochaetes bacterium]|jgi:nucleoside-diphosphate-sugar epimerase|nr:NAD(P)-dependent oxidoreductase [Spirochaetota bacterium]